MSPPRESPPWPPMLTKNIPLATDQLVGRTQAMARFYEWYPESLCNEDEVAGANLAAELSNREGKTLNCRVHQRWLTTSKLHTYPTLTLVAAETFGASKSSPPHVHRVPLSLRISGMFQLLNVEWRRGEVR